MNKTFFGLKIVTLLLVMTLFVAFAPSLQMAQAKTNTKQVSYSSSLLQDFNAKYFDTFGYKSAETIQFSATEKTNTAVGSGVYSVSTDGRQTIVSVESNLQSALTNGTLTSYDYQAKFMLGSEISYVVHESYLSKTIAEQTIETLNEKITGAFNLSISLIGNTTAKNNFAEKQRNVEVAFANSTNSYNMHLSSNDLWNVKDNRLLNGSIVFDQNMIGKPGTYKLDYSTVNDGSKLKLNLTRPDGSILDPWYSIIYDTNFPLYLTGFEESYLSAEWIIDDAIIGVTALILVETVVPSAVLGVIAIVMGVATLYTADMGGWGVIIVYFEVVSIFLSFPLQAELGFYTNQIGGIPLGYWLYWPVFSTFLPTPHIGLWPFPLNDPPLSVFAYDDSSYTFFEGIPIYISGNFAGTTSTTMDMPPGTYTIEVPNYGSFAYFDVGGSPNYDNPATITLGNDPVTVVAHYSYRPMVTLTVDAYDTYFGGWINPYVSIDGVSSGYAPITVQVPPGFYYISFDQGYGTLYLPWYSSITDGYNYYNPGDSIPIFYGTEVTGLYTLGG